MHDLCAKNITQWSLSQNLSVQCSKVNKLGLNSDHDGWGVVVVVSSDIPLG